VPRDGRRRTQVHLSAKAPRIPSIERPRVDDRRTTIKQFGRRSDRVSFGTSATRQPALRVRREFSEVTKHGGFYLSATFRDSDYALSRSSGRKGGEGENLGAPALMRAARHRAASVVLPLSLDVLSTCFNPMDRPILSFSLNDHYRFSMDQFVPEMKA
jgi:hypothetical protein